MTTEITTTVTAPVGAIIAVGGLLVYGGSKIVTYTNCV
jgi:type II secretory pathway component GspD/PulD (secretin)